MKKLTLSKKYVLIAVAAVLVIIIAGGVIKKDWLKGQYYRYQAKSTLSAEIKKLNGPLTAMGFDTSKVTTDCYINKVEPMQCYATLNSYHEVGDDQTTLAALNISAKELSTLLDSNGWIQRPDLRTIDWFNEISKGIDYQPDQLNHKVTGDWDCIVDFFTAFSKPSPVAISLQASCYVQQT